MKLKFSEMINIRGIKAIEFLEEMNLIRDSTILEFSIITEKKTNQVKVKIKVFKKDKNYKLTFLKVKKCLFYLTSGQFLYLVEDYKLRVSDNSFYLSFDPDFSVQAPCETDNDFILAEDVVVTI